MAAQSPEKLLELGQRSYTFDKKDSADYYFGKAYKQTDSNIKLRAITGLLKVALLRSDMAASDSLVQLADVILTQDLDKNAVCTYEIWKGEFYKKNSELEKALKLQKAVVSKTRNWEQGKVVHADALFYTALTFERLTEYDSSIAYIEKAYQLYKENLDTTSVKFAEIYNGLGNSYYRKNEFKKAKTYYLKSKEVSEKHLGPVSSDLAVVLGNLSSISRTEENYHEAIDYSEEALRIFRLLDDKKGISVSYYSLGVFYYFLGDYGRTKDYMEACITLREELYHPKHYTLINPYEVMGIALEESGNYEQTLFYLKKARPIIKANFGAASLQEGLNSENMAICFQKLGELDSAWRYVKIANKILTEKLSGNAYQLGTHHFTYASVLRQKGQLEKAKESIATSNKIYENLGMANSTEYAQSLATLGMMAAQEKDWQMGDKYFDQALQKIQDSDSSIVAMPNNLTILNEYISYLYEKYIALEKDKDLTTFQTYSNKYLSVSENLRKQSIDPYSKSILVKDNAQLYNKMVGIYYQLYKKTINPDHLTMLYRFSEYGRAAMLRDMQDEKISYYAGVPDSVTREENNLKRRVRELNQQIVEGNATAENKQQLFEAKEALNNYIAHLEESYPKYHQLKFATENISLNEVQANLKEGENVVEYMQSDTAYYAILINTEEADAVYLGNTKEIDTEIKNWKEAIVTQNQAKIRENGFQLYKKLWEPFIAKLQGERVIAIPIGPLFYLNLETLSKSVDKDEFLVYDYNISYALSLNAYFIKDSNKADGKIISVAPGFEEELKTAYQESFDTLQMIDEEYLKTVRQPWTVRLANSLNDKFDNTILTGLQATESNIKQNINQAGILYFGTHAITNAVDPLRSKLVLAKEIGDQKEDGYLHAYELFGLQLNAELAVLNACESGLGSIKKGEGMISLAYSMQYAGCPSTVMSLWKIDEKVNTKITEDFFEQLSQGKTKSEALRNAKLAYLQTAKGTLASPFYWGGMVLMGKDSEISIERTLPSVWLISAICLAIAALAIIATCYYTKKI